MGWSSFASSAIDIGSKALDIGSEVASTALDVGGEYFSDAANYAGKAFQYVNDNPEVANALGGVASGVGQYYMAEKEREQTVRENRKNRQLERDLANQQIDAAKISPGDTGGAGGYIDNVTNGLISNGMLASKQGGN